VLFSVPSAGGAAVDRLAQVGDVEHPDRAAALAQETHEVDAG